MEAFNTTSNCPECGFYRLKSWTELTDCDKLVANSQPASAQFTLAERKKHRFCTRCWFEEIESARDA